MGEKQSSGQAPPKILSAIFALVGFGMLGGAAWTGTDRLAVLQSWPTTQATVASSEITQHEDRDDHSTTYGVKIVFRFQVEGKGITATSTAGYTTSMHSVMQGIADKFSPGTNHPIRFNPAAPGEVYFNAGWNFGFFGIPLFLTGMGLVFAGVGVVMFRRRAKASPYSQQGRGKLTSCPACGKELWAGMNKCPACGAALPGK